ncbi:hypothetical protein Zmor_008719 [Zophobas morio]|uniref:Uncharacterized protein n=1 Tax=Zophobas morio TaxID=2755281 RepID=A0AA38M041_9CUCU|nr:hypothetical protein Zmor_008719 [Zophobas morio]
MKKLLTLLGAIGLVATSSATVVSCNDIASFEGYSGNIIQALETETFFVPSAEGSSEGAQIDMSTNFDEIGNLYVGIKEKDFTTAVNNAISSVVSSKQDTDYTLKLNNFIESGTSDKSLEIVLTAKDTGK